MNQRWITLTLSIIYFLSIVYVMVLIQQWSDYRCEYPVEFKIKDLGFELIPQIALPWLPDVWVSVSTLIFFLRFAFSGKMVIITKRFFFILGTIYLFRTVSVSLTTYPVPPMLPEHHIYRPTNPFINAFLVVYGSRHTYSDLIFSGHTSVLTVSALFWAYYARGKFLFFLYMLINILGAVAIISARFHNSVDVFLALIISSGAFWGYHMLIGSQCKCDRRSWLNWFDSGEHCESFYCKTCYGRG